MNLRFITFLTIFTLCSMVFAQEFRTVKEVRETSEPLRHYWQSFCMRSYPIPDWQNAFQDQRFLRGPFGSLSGTEVKLNFPIVVFIKNVNSSRLSYHTHEIVSLFSESLSPSLINEWTGTFQGMPYLNGSNWGIFDKSIIFPFLSQYHIGNRGLLIRLRRNPYFSPFYNQGYTFPLSISFERLGLFDKAWRVQLEEGILETRGIHPFYGNGYYTKGYEQGNRSFYLYAANNAYRAGNKKLGWSFLMSAAVFENEESFEMAMATAELWLAVEAGKQKMPEAKILSGDERKKAFLEIVECYQKMNAHPRAWLFVQEYKSEFDDADTLIKTIQDDWLEIVNIATNPQHANKIIMYGVELYPTKNNPLSIQLPWAFPEGSIEKLKKTLQEEAERIREEEKDDFRSWYQIIEGERYSQAKYESCTGGKVTLIKPDGTKIVHQFTDISSYDQNYVRRRLDIARVEKAQPRELIYPIRPWHSANGKFSTEARYLSSSDQSVQMEKDDGTVIRVELSKLSWQDQNYVQQCKKMVETMQHKNVKKK